MCGAIERKEIWFLKIEKNIGLIEHNRPTTIKNGQIHP